MLLLLMVQESALGPGSVDPQGQVHSNLTVPSSPQLWLRPLHVLTGAYDFEPQRCLFFFPL